MNMVIRLNHGFLGLIPAAYNYGEYAIIRPNRDGDAL